MLLKFTIILKNNSSNQITVLDNLLGNVTNDSIIFNDIELDLLSGEYTALLFLNYRSDVTYNFNIELIKTEVVVNNDVIPIRLLRPIIQLLKVEGEDIKNITYNPQIKDINYTQNYNVYFYKN